MLIPNINRFQAFAIHLALSLAIFVAIILLIINVWYPSPLFVIDGAWQGFKIVAFVDVILGPLVTLIIYNTKKKSLKFDLCVVVSIQFACLIAGTFLVYNARPVALVLVEDTFSTISAGSDVPQQDIERIPGEYPKMIILDLPDKPAERHATIYMNSQAHPIEFTSGLYMPYEEKMRTNLIYSIKFPEYYKENPEKQPALDKLLKKLNKKANQVALYKIQGKYATSHYIVDGISGEILTNL